MKRIVLTIMAVAALAACTKSEIAYEAPAEIGFAPATKNITKAAVESGTLPTSNNLGVWAYWNGTNGSASETTATYANYTDAYLSNALFSNREGTNNWGGANNTAYPWPTTGALVFAGYTVPATTQTSDFGVTYSLIDNSTTTDVNETDVMTFNNYTQSTLTASTYDLCWFGRTSSSFNYRTSNTAVPVTLSHALTWITFKIKGATSSSLPVTAGWKVTKVELNGIKNVGTGTCVGTTSTTTTNGATTITPASAVWSFASNAATNTMSVYPNNSETGQVITANATKIETTDKGVVVIPQTPTTVTVEWQYNVGSKTKKETKTLSLALGNGADWKAGVHYTYTIVFDSNEILVAPSYSGWDTPTDQTVTVQ